VRLTLVTCVIVAITIAYLVWSRNFSVR